MEPADIDWNNVDSRFVRDDLYEHFDAPKWVDFTGEHRGSNDDGGGDEAWFCRPDCRHLKTQEDYLQMSSSSTPPKPKDSVLGPLCISSSITNQQRDGNLKRRGVLLPSHLTSSSSLVSSLLRHSPRAKLATSKKKSWDDIENQNPNINSPARTHTVNSGVKAVKDITIKSSAEKPKREEMGELQHQRHDLKSTRSARNLFSGKDILSQISEFCNEIKKLAMIGSDRKPLCRDEEGDDEKKLEPQKEKSRKKLGKYSNSNQCRRPECREGLALLQQEVRSSPPTPQQIPSPVGRYKQAKASPLKPLEPLPPERGVLQELEKNKENECELPQIVENGCSFVAPAGTEAKALHMLWFLKPCTYLGR